MNRPRLLIERWADGRTAAARLHGTRLEDLLIDPAPDDASPMPGEIRLGKIERRVPKLGAAFVALGGGETGFLREAAREWERALVQVVSRPEPGKAAPVTRRILLKGRLAILSPAAPGVNVSRRIKDAPERARLEAAGAGALAAGLDALPEPLRAALAGTGAILRSAAEGADEVALAAEIAALVGRLARLTEAAEAAGGPALLRPVRAAETALAEWTDPAPERLRLAPEAWDWLRGPEGPALPLGPLGALCERAEADLFEAEGVWEAAAALSDRRVDLPGGGRMSVEPTAALVAVDVDAGGGFGGGDALSANLAAARELPRQLRLRGLGGIVTVDFAPIPKRERKRVEQALEAAFRSDPVETSLAGWTTLGLFELQRKRERRPLAELLPV